MVHPHAHAKHCSNDLGVVMSGKISQYLLDGLAQNFVQIVSNVQ